MNDGDDQHCDSWKMKLKEMREAIYLNRVYGNHKKKRLEIGKLSNFGHSTFHVNRRGIRQS